MRADRRNTGAAAAATVARTAAPPPTIQLTFRQGLLATPAPGSGGPPVRQCRRSNVLQRAATVMIEGRKPFKVMSEWGWGALLTESDTSSTSMPLT